MLVAVVGLVAWVGVEMVVFISPGDWHGFFVGGLCGDFCCALASCIWLILVVWLNVKGEVLGRYVADGRTVGPAGSEICLTIRRRNTANVCMVF